MKYAEQAAFIAGVQAQVITFTIALPHSALQRAANFFAFLGLVFEIAGTFIGAIHSILIQRRSKNKSLLLQQITLFKADLKVILKWYAMQKLDERQRVKKLRGDEEGSSLRQGAEGPHTSQPERDEKQPGWSTAMDESITNFYINGDFANIAMNRTMLPPQIGNNPDSEDRKERLQRVETFFQEIQHRPLSSSQEYIIDVVLNILHSLSLGPSPGLKNVPRRQSTYRTLDIVPPVVRPMFTFGNIPLVSMAVGVAFLATSTILLAAASEVLASEVWISCMGALLLVMTLSLLPFRYASLHSFSWVDIIE